MYGTRVFVSFVFRAFRDGKKTPRVSKEQVETHTPNFPAATPEQEAAKAALADAYGQDLKKWAELKLLKN